MAHVRQFAEHKIKFEGGYITYQIILQEGSVTSFFARLHIYSRRNDVTISTNSVGLHGLDPEIIRAFASGLPALADAMDAEVKKYNEVKEILD